MVCVSRVVSPGSLATERSELTLKALHVKSVCPHRGAPLGGANTLERGAPPRFDLSAVLV